MNRTTFVLAHPAARENALRAVREAPEGLVVQIRPKTRSLEQNALMWPLLEDLAQQVNWYGQRLTKEEWKDVMTAALKKQKAVPGVDGGFVVLGEKTSTYSKQEFSDLIEQIYCFGAQQGVEFRTDEGMK